MMVGRLLGGVLLPHIRPTLCHLTPTPCRTQRCPPFGGRLYAQRAGTAATHWFATFVHAHTDATRTRTAFVVMVR